MDDDKTWDYKPDVPEAKGEDMSWTASEYIDHSRGPSWYLGLIVVTAIITFAVYLVTKDYLATGMVVFAGIIIGFFSMHKPKQVAYELSSSQLKAGQKTYPLNIFKSFALIHEGAVSSINFIPIKRFMPPLSVYFDPADETKVVSLLGGQLPLEEGGLDAVEKLARRLRF